MKSLSLIPGGGKSPATPPTLCTVFSNSFVYIGKVVQEGDSLHIMDALFLNVNQKGDIQFGRMMEGSEVHIVNPTNVHIRPVTNPGLKDNYNRAHAKLISGIELPDGPLPFPPKQ